MRMFALMFCALTVIGASLDTAYGAPRGHIDSPEFEWVDLSKCRIPRVKPPPMPVDSEEEYGFERRYLALGEGETCVLMESYVEALFGSHSTGMQVLASRYYRLVEGRWEPTSKPFLYFPYAVRGKSDGRLYFVDVR